MAATRTDSCSLTPTIKPVGAPWEETISHDMMHIGNHADHFAKQKIFGQFSAKDKTLCKGDMLRPTLVDLAPAVAQLPVDCRQQRTLRSCNAGPESQCGLWRLLKCRSSKSKKTLSRRTLLFCLQSQIKTSDKVICLSAPQTLLLSFGGDSWWTIDFAHSHP